MELDVKLKIEHKESQIQLTKVEESHSINLYKTPPFGRLTLEQCEDLFRQRLEALMIIDKIDLYSGATDLSNKLRAIKSYAYKTNCIMLRASDKQQRKLDHYSHMLLRLYCVYNQHHWDWFTSCEKKLLLYRLRDQASCLSGAQLESILKSFNFDFTRVAGNELNQLRAENLINWSRRDFDRDNTDVFRVKFTDALRFVARRSVALKDGFAFLSRHDIISIVCDVFERHLQTELSYAQQHLITEQAQTKYLLESLDTVYADYQETFEAERRRLKREENGENRNPFKIDLDNLAEIIPKHYPPCIRYLHKALTDDHHLKHQGRMLYQTFLRSNGVDLEDNIEFFRKEFTKKIANETFERQYKYNIRHLYGREGHKQALSCYSCDKIINDNAPGPSEKHGCPFRHFDNVHLKSMLKDHGLKDVDIESLVTHKENKEYKVACGNYFKFMKGDFPSEPIYSPAQFYRESMKLAHAPKPVEEEEDQDGFDDDFEFEPPIEKKSKEDNSEENGGEIAMVE